MVFVFLCLTSLSMIISRSIHVAANGIISFFLWLIFHCVYIYRSVSLSLYLSISHLHYPFIC